MKIYLVGGAVRDALLNRRVVEKDYVVVGATPEQLTALNFTQVGKDFPVFLHPDSKDEYALARTERKSGQGYHGFKLCFDPSVTLTEDLMRRDLTVNALAIATDKLDQTDLADLANLPALIQKNQQHIIDPYKGLDDLQNKVLRHVSPAFAEDPLRVLRVARFAARYAHLGFSVAPETLALMRQLAESGELATLTPERIWKETQRALAEKDASVYFEVLRNCGALAVIFPEIDALFGIPQPVAYHPEIDTGLHTLLSLEQACKANANAMVRFAVLVHDLGKALTPNDMLPSHRGHEEKGVIPVQNLCQRLKVPKSYEQLAVAVCRFHLKCHRAFELKASSIVKLLNQLDGIRNPDKVANFVQACMFDAKGRTGLENRDYPQAEYLLDCLKAISAIKFTDLPKNITNKGGEAIANAFYQARVSAVKQVVRQS